MQPPTHPGPLVAVLGVLIGGTGATLALAAGIPAYSMISFCVAGLMVCVGWLVNHHVRPVAVNVVRS